MTSCSLHRARVAFFVLFLGAPGLCLALGLDSTRLGDEDALLQPLQTALSEPFRPLEWALAARHYLQRTFGFRGALVRAHGLLKVQGLGVSSAPGKVLLGRDGWLFFAAEHTLDDIHRVRLLQPRELAHYRSIISSRRERLQRRGALYIFIVAPDKHTVYPQFLPSNVVVPAAVPSLLDQLQDELGALSLDVRPTLWAAARRGEQVYHRTDTHWNDLGALRVGEQIANELRKERPAWDVPSLSQVEVRTIRLPAGDLARMLGLKFDMHEVAPFVSFYANSGARQPPADTEVSSRTTAVVRVFNPRAPLGKALMFRDSFGEALASPLSQLFRELILVTRSFDHVLLAREEPDVVIDEIVERHVMTP